jgi:hypothetical protein
MENTTDTTWTIPTDRWLAGRTFWGIALILLAAHALLIWLARSPGILVGQDDATYLLLARSLGGFEYRDLFTVGEPLHAKYPPGYPAILAGWGQIFGDSFDAFVTLSIVASVVTLGLLASVLRARWSASIALLCVLLLIVNPQLVGRAGTVRSELPFAALTMGTLWALARRPADRHWLILALALSVLAAMVRIIGITLVAAVILVWMYEKRFRWAAALTTAGILTIGGWFAWVFATGNPSYFTEASLVRPAPAPADTLGLPGGAGDVGIGVYLVEFFNRVVVGMPRFLGLQLTYRLPLPTLEGPTIDNWVNAVLAMAGCTVGFFAFARRWRGAAAYLVLYFGLIAVWTWKSPRLLEPVLFLLVPMFLIGVGMVLRKMSGRLAVVATGLLGLIMFTTGAVRTAELFRPGPTIGGRVRNAGCDLSEERLLERGRCLPPDLTSYYAAADYVQRRIPANAVFLTAKPEPLFYHTGRQSVEFFDMVNVATPEDFAPRLREEKVDYLLLGSWRNTELGNLAPLIRGACEDLRLVESFPPRAYIFRLAGDADSTTAASACAAMAEYFRANARRNFAEGYPVQVPETGN